VQCGPPDTSCAVIFPFDIPEVVADIAAAAAVETCIGDSNYVRREDGSFSLMSGVIRPCRRAYVAK
jgi:hypothetical protein